MKRKSASSPVAASLLAIVAALACSGASARSTASSLQSEKMTVNFRETPVKDAVALIAAKARLALKMQGEPKGQVTYEAKGSTLEQVLQHIATEAKFEYSMANDTLTIVIEDGSEPNSGGADKPASDMAFRSVPIKYANAKELLGSVTQVLRTGESVVGDDVNNALILHSSEKTFDKVRQFVGLYDRQPLQILIEAQIVETTRNFARDLGITWGDMQITEGSAKKMSGLVTTPAPSNPTAIIRGLIGSINGSQLEARLLAAENNGEAKVVSRPRVFTLNNRRAVIHSGITYHVKTLSSISSGGGSGGTGGTAAGGLQEISAGLQFEVTPTIVGDGLVRIAIRVQNSEPNEGSGVDGIPGIINNSAETSILVQGGQTATMAGLIKSSLASAENSVPWLTKIPLIGWIFSSHSKRDRGSELMIFITPHIVDMNETRKTAKETVLNPIQE